MNDAEFDFATGPSLIAIQRAIDEASRLLVEGQQGDVCRVIAGPASTAVRVGPLATGLGRYSERAQRPRSSRRR